DGPLSLLLSPGRSLVQDTALALPADPASNVMHLRQAGWDPQYGDVYILFKTCADLPAFGLEARVDGSRKPDAVTFYSSLSTQPTPTTSMALMGGVEPGLRVISAWEDIPGRGKVKVAEQSVMVKPGSVTYVP